MASRQQGYCPYCPPQQQGYCPHPPPLQQGHPPPPREGGGWNPPPAAAHTYFPAQQGGGGNPPAAAQQVHTYYPAQQGGGGNPPPRPVVQSGSRFQIRKKMRAMASQVVVGVATTLGVGYAIESIHHGSNNDDSDGADLGGVGYN